MQFFLHLPDACVMYMHSGSLRKLTECCAQPQPLRTAMHHISRFRLAVRSFTAAKIASTMSSCTPHVTTSEAWSVAGRLLIAQGAVDACKVGTAIAIRYSCKRPQFGEKMIMEYITQQRRLLPGLATTYAMQVSMMRLRVRFAKIINNRNSHHYHYHRYNHSIIYDDDNNIDNNNNNSNINNDNDNNNNNNINNNSDIGGNYLRVALLSISGD